MDNTLYKHIRHPHVPRNPNVVHKEEMNGSLKDKQALWITNHVGTMECAYLFFGIGIGSLVGVLTNNPILAGACGAVSSYILQLVLLPIILKGQSIQGRKQEILAEENFEATKHILHDSDEVMHHLDAQDDKILVIEQQNTEQIKLIVDRDDALATLMGTILIKTGEIASCLTSLEKLSYSSELSVKTGQSSNSSTLPSLPGPLASILYAPNGPMAPSSGLATWEPNTWL